MEFSIDRGEFTQALGLTQGVVERRNTMPILANVLIEADETLSISATDLEVHLRRRCGAKVKTAGSATVPARKFYELVRELGQGDVTVRLLENNFVEVTSGRSRVRLVGLPAEDFPSFPQGEKGASKAFTIDSETLCLMIDRTLFAVSTDDTRAHLGGVLLIGSEEGLRFVGTDGHRLAKFDQPMTGVKTPDKGLILPRKGLSELRRLLEGRQGDVEIQVAGNAVRAEIGDVAIVMRLIDGEFPNYEQVIPSEVKIRLALAKDELMSALKRVSVVASDRARGVRLALSQGQLTVSASSPDFGEASEELEIPYDGDEMSVGFNSRYLTDVLAVLPDEAKVEIGLSDDVSPGVISIEDERETYEYVVMPMRL
jgi:DNA polymerase-3 subunit beta